MNFFVLFSWLRGVGIKLQIPLLLANSKMEISRRLIKYRGAYVYTIVKCNLRKRDDNSVHINEFLIFGLKHTKLMLLTANLFSMINVHVIYLFEYFRM